MKTAPSYLLAFSAVLAAIFPDVGIEAFNITLNTIWIVLAGVFVMLRQLTTGRATLVGGRPRSFNIKHLN